MTILSTFCVPLVNYGTGAPLPGAVVTVYKYDTTVKASIYNLSGSATANPIVADASGLVKFQAEAGYLYEIVWSAGMYTSPRFVVGENELADFIAQASAILAQTTATLAAAIPADRALNSDAVAASLSFKSIVYNQNIAARKVIGTSETLAGEYTNGGDYDCSTMPRGLEFDVQSRRSATQDTIIRLGYGQSFTDNSGSNTLTLGKGRGAKIKRLSQLTYRASILPIDPSEQEIQSGSWTLWPSGRGNLWTAQYRASVACPSDTALTLPTGLSGLTSTRAGIVASISNDTTYTSDPQALVPEVVDDTHITIHNPNNSTELGATTNLTLMIFGLTYTATTSRGSAVYSTLNPTGIDYTLFCAGQSNMAVPMMGNGPASFDSRIISIATKKNFYYVNQAYSGSTILYGATTAGNEWWNQNTASPGARTTALVAAINAVIASGAPAPDYVVFDVGQSEAIRYGTVGYSFITPAAWIAAVQSILAYVRTNTSLPSLAFIWNPIGRWGSDGIDVGLNVIRQAQLSMCDGVNIIQGADGVLASLREAAGDGVHYDERGQIIIWEQLADIFGNLKLSTTEPLGPTIGSSGFKRVSGTLDTFEVTITASSGSITHPVSPGGIALLPSSNAAGTPIALDATTPYSWVSNKLRIKTAADQATAPYLCWPYGSAAVDVASIITDGSGYAIRSRTMIQAT